MAIEYTEDGVAIAYVEFGYRSVLHGPTPALGNIGVTLHLASREF